MYEHLARYAGALARLHRPLLLLFPNRVLAVTGREWGMHAPKNRLTITFLPSKETADNYRALGDTKRLTNLAIDNALQNNVADASQFIKEADTLINQESSSTHPVTLRAMRAESLAIHALILQTSGKPEESAKTMEQAMTLINSIYHYRPAVLFEFDNVIKINALLMMKRREYKNAEAAFAKEVNFAGSSSSPMWAIERINYSTLKIIQGKPHSAQIMLNECLKYCPPYAGSIKDIAAHNLSILNEGLSKAQQPPAPPELASCSLS